MPGIEPRLVLAKQALCAQVRACPKTLVRVGRFRNQKVRRKNISVPNGTRDPLYFIYGLFGVPLHIGERNMLYLVCCRKCRFLFEPCLNLKTCLCIIFSLLFLCFFERHIRCCSGFTCASELRDHSCQKLEYQRGARDQVLVGHMQGKLPYSLYCILLC